MGRLFGTDGVRGLANADLTPNWRSASRWRPRRCSRSAPAVPGGRWWSAATRGPAARCSRRPWWPGWPAPARTCCGSACCRRRPSRTWSRELGADLGVMLSASHNPMPDNGIKLFAARRAQAGRRGRGRDRGRGSASTWTPADRRRRRPRPRPARRRRALRRAPARARCRTRWTGCRSSWTARTARRPRVAPGACYRRPAPRSSRSPPSRTG